MNKELTDVEIETSTDDVEDVKAALGELVEVEVSGGDEGAQPEEGETPEGEPETEESTEEQPADGKPAVEESETEEGQEPKEKQPKAKESKPAKADVPMVPKARLNEEIRKRKDAESKLAAKGEIEPDDESDEPEDRTGEPQFFSGKPKPVLKEFTKDVDKFDPEAMADAQAKHAEALMEWGREEGRAEAEYRRAVERDNARKAEFRERESQFVEANPDYPAKLRAAKGVMIDPATEDFIYESEVGPAMLLHFAEHPREAKRFFNMRGVTRAEALLQLQADIKAQSAEESEESGVEEEGEPGSAPPKKTIPPKKPSAPAVSKAPVPPNRLKPSGPGPKSERELAGPEDRTGVDIEYNPEYEKAVNARRRNH